MLGVTFSGLKTDFEKLKTVPSSQLSFLLSLTGAVLLWEEVFLSQRERKDELNIFLILPAATILFFPPRNHEAKSILTVHPDETE